MAKREIWHPAEYDQEDVRAIQTLAQYADGSGEAVSPAQCRRALDWIILKAAATYDNGFVAHDPGGHIGAFIDGRQSVGQQIVKLIKLTHKVFEK
jgi:hypothetical protein